MKKARTVGSTRRRLTQNLAYDLYVHDLLKKVVRTTLELYRWRTAFSVARHERSQPFQKYMGPYLRKTLSVL